MQCPACEHEAPAASFGDPLRCPECGAFYEKAVQLKAKRDAMAVTTAPKVKPALNHGGVAPTNIGTPEAIKASNRFWGRVFAVFGLIVVSLTIYKNFLEPAGVKLPVPAKEPYLAPIGEGAIPARIGCDEGCDRLNLFERWQPYLHKVVEVHRRQEKCRKVEYVSVSNESSPDDPVFFVMCEDAKGRAYNTEYKRSDVEAGLVARGDDVSQRYALSACEKELPRYFSGYFKGAVTKTGFYVAPNGRAQVFYDLVIAGQPRSGRCLVGHDFVEFTVVN